jgi:RND family efflux transporter MFP subunit
MSRRAVILVAVVIVAVTAAAALTLTPAGDALYALITRRPPAAAAAGDQATAAHPPAHAAAETAVTPRGPVTIDARRQQLIGVRLTSVRRTSITPEIRASAIVRYDETRQSEINTRVDGWIRELHADFTGKTITRGEPLFTLYSPELLNAQNEYLLAVRGRTQSSGAQVPAVREYSERLVDAARERLLRWDLAEADIQRLEQSGAAVDTIAFRSPVSGIIVEKAAVEGMRVMAGQTLFRIADLSTIWVEADVYEQDLSLVRIGQNASITVDAYPGERLAGRAIYVYPTVDERTRTAKVRFRFPNRGGRLKPGMFATVELVGAAASALTIPVDALIDTGTEQVVFVAQGDGYFEPRRVRIGRRTSDEVVITDGLKEGEQVATGANFFLDSESQLRAGLQNYEAPPGQPGSAEAPREQIAITFRPQPDPPRTGENTLEVTVRDASGQPVSDADVTVTFFMAAMPTMNMPAMRNQAKLPPAGEGVYRGPGQVVMAGRWDVTVDVTRGGERLGSSQFAIMAR